MPERNSRFELLPAADAYFRGFETNGTPDYIPAPLLPEVDRRENGILYTNTRIGASQLSTARSGFDAGRFKGMQVRDRRYPVVDSETGAVMSLVRFGDPMGPLSKASLPFDRNGKEHKAPDVMVGASFVSEIFAVSSGKIAEVHAYWTPSEGNVLTPRATGTVPVDPLTCAKRAPRTADTGALGDCYLCGLRLEVQTRLPECYDQTFSYLQDIGLPESG